MSYSRQIYNETLASLDFLDMKGLINNHRLDDFCRLTQPFGSIDKAISNNLYGLNHRQTDSLASDDRILQGYTFFTRPMLCLTINNLRRKRTFMSLANTNPYSVQRYVRCTLDPRVSTNVPIELFGKDDSGNPYIDPIECSPLVDNDLMFIPLLSNTILSSSGWPDPNLPVHTTKENVRGGQQSKVDGIAEINGSFDISCTFRNIKDSPLMLMMYYWINYMACVVDEQFIPYMDMLGGNEIDYNTRIYRLIMDETNTFVKGICATGASFPSNIDIGKYFNFNKGNPFTDQGNEISINFKSMGCTYFDPILVDEFNKTVCIGSYDMRIVRLYKIKNLQIPDTDAIKVEKVPQELLRYFNFRGYPFIDYNTMELEWYVRKDSPTYKFVVKNIKK